MPSPVFNTPVLPLLTTVFTSILEVFLLCLAGYVLAARGVLDKKTQKQINRLNVSLFTPALLFSKVAFFLSPAKLRELWIIPIFFVVVTLVSMSVAFVLGWLAGLTRSQRSFAMAAAMFMNSNSLPIALMQSLVVAVPGLKWGKDDNKNAMVGRALTYLVLYSTLGMVLRWSYGVKLLAQADDEVAPADDEADSEASPLLAAYDSRDSRDSPDADAVPDVVVHPAARRPSVPRRRSTYYRSFPNSPNGSRAHLPSVPSESASLAATAVASSASASDADSDGETSALYAALPTHRRRSRADAPKPTRTRALARRTLARLGRAWRALRDFMTTPLWAAAASLLVACVAPLQHALDAHMAPVKGALAAAGSCSIPLTLIVLGAYFYAPSAGEAAAAAGAAGAAGGAGGGGGGVRGAAALLAFKQSRAGIERAPAPARPGETATVVISVAARMVLTPLLLLPLMALSTKFDLQAVFDDPVFVVANVLLISSPPALTLAQITQAASGDAFERLISRTIFWAYCVVTPPATIAYVVVGLLLSKL